MRKKLILMTIAIEGGRPYLVKWTKPDGYDGHESDYDITAGDLPTQARAFVLNFGEGESTGITTTNYTNDTNSDNAWFTLDGRKLSQKPSQHGIYIKNGKKVVIK